MKENNLAKIIFVLMILTFAQNVAEGQNPDSIIWPGDVNNNGVVNQYDVLYLGGSYNLQGPSRDFGSIAWGGQDVAQNWPGFGEGLNAAFADCNGNGLVQDSDLQAIEVNYGLTHDTVFADTFIVSNDEETEIAFNMMGNVIQGTAGQAFTIPIDLGNDNLIIEDFYGLAFTINVNTDFIDLSSLSFTIDNNWMDSNNSGLLSIQKKNFADNTFDVGLSRRNMESTSGSGVIGYVSFVIEDDVPGFAPDTEVLTFQETRVLDKNLLQIYQVNEGNLLIDFTSRVAELPKSEFSIYPNPINNGICSIKGLENYPDAEVRLLDIVGREMKTDFVNDTFNVNHLPSGVYFININTAKGRLTEKIIINN